jgi:hypothetical protein
MHHPSIAAPTESAGGGKGLQHVAMLEFLEHDPRPTFVLETNNLRNERCISTLPIYTNPALAAVDEGQLLATIQDRTLTIPTPGQRYALSEFRSWITELQGDRSCLFAAHNWSKLTLASGWTVVFGARVEPAVPAATNQYEGAMLSKRTSRSKVPTYDWTDEIPPLKMTPHVAWARSIDWAQTPLGPMTMWSSQLRSIANLVMQDPRPAVVFYGPDLIMIYNEAEIELLGGFHPCMGMSARVALASVWAEYFEPIITQNLAGDTVEKTDSAIHMVRNGYLEETYFSLKFIPILDSEGATVGHYEPLTETVSHNGAEFMTPLSNYNTTISLLHQFSARKRCGLVQRLQQVVLLP